MENERFFEEEIRGGVKVDSMKKRVWAVQLKLLDEVERICGKYGLRYFADSGTLIGAVRERGYIPWDDDIDLVMMREDYEIFTRVAPGELHDPLVLQTAYTEDNYLRGHAQLRDGSTTGYTAEDLKAGYNCGIFIDIFPLDGMPDGSRFRSLWAARIRFVWSALYAAYRFGYYENATIAGRILNGLARLLSLPMRTAYARYEALCCRYSKRDTKYVCNTVFVRRLEKNTWERRWFDEAVYMPFENRMIPVPVGYDERLKAEYGDYLRPVQAPTMHGDVVLNADVPYWKFLEKEISK